MSDEQETEIGPHTQVSHEQDGRVLSGVGISPDRLAETMERHAPAEKSPPEAGTEPAKATPTPSQSEAPVAKPTRGQQRFSELAAERNAAREEAAREKAERERIAQDFEAFKAAQSKPSAPADPAKPKEQEKPKTWKDKLAGVFIKSEYEASQEKAHKNKMREPK